MATATIALARPVRFSDQRWALRGVGALAAVVAAVAHIPVTGAHLEEVPYIGVAFVVLTAVCVVGAVAIVARDARWAWWACGVSCALSVAAYLVSRSVGLPGMADDIGNWWEMLGVISVVSESIVAAAAFSAVRRS